MNDAWERARTALKSAGLPPDRLAALTPLTGGTYNTVEELRLTDGTRHVLKTAPGTEGLSHERGLLVAEAEFYDAAARAGVPAPRTLALDAGHLLMTAVPGTPWPDAGLTPAEQTSLRAELGRHVAALHRITGPGHGYPSGALGPLAGDWRTAFTGMLDAVLADVERYRPQLPCPAGEIAATLARAYGALDEVGAPRLVHFDLWPGNILVDRTPEGPRVGGLIDGERMFWGDPLADLVSLALLSDIRADEVFLEAYGQREFDVPAQLRLALYRAYLYLIMLTEIVPRNADEGHLRWVRETVAPQLLAALAEIGALTA